MNFADSRNFIATLTARKLLNGIKLFSSYHQSKLTGRPKLSALPLTVSVEPTTACNLRCPECPSGLRSFTRPRGMLEINLYKQIIEEIGDTLMYLYLYFQGEPFLHPNFLDLVALANSKHIYTVTSTNAHFLDDEMARKTIESGLSRIIISIDGTSQSTYENYRVDGELAKVIEGTSKLIKWKRKLKAKTPHIVFQFLVVKANEHQIPEIYKLADKLGVDEVKLKTTQVYNYKNGNPLIPENEKYSRYKKQGDGTYVLKNKLLNQCWKMWHSCVITWDGKIVPCCFDKDASHQLGNIQQHSFKAIWYGEAYDRFRQKLLKSRSKIDICTNCTEGTKVWS